MDIIINKFKKVLPFLAIPLLFSAKCNKEDTAPCRNGRYVFNVTSEFIPQKEIYNVGDTIFLTSNFPKKLFDNYLNQLIDYSNNVGIDGNLICSLMDSSNRKTGNAINLVALNAISGVVKLIDNNTSVSIIYKENTDNFEIKIGIKLLTKGLFYTGVTNLGSNGIRGQDCTNAGFGMTVINSNKNLHLFQNAMGYAPDALLSKNIYCFRVQ